VVKKTDDLELLLNELVINSSFLGALDRCGESYNITEGLRRLSSREVEILKEQGNYCVDWSLIEVEVSFSTRCVTGSSFFGKCVLGGFDGASLPLGDGLFFPNGIYNSTLIDSKIESGALVANTNCVSGCFVREGAAVFGLGMLSSSTPCYFANGTKIRVGNETGGRDIRLIADMDFDTASAVIMNREPSFIKLFDVFYDKYLARMSFNRCVVEKGAVIKNSAAVKNCFIGEYAVIDGASLVEDSAILSSKQAPVVISSGAVVRSSCLQQGSSVNDMAIADCSLLTPYSAVTRHGKAKNCVIGSNTEIAEGEATSSLVGPFTGYHHQSLLIASLWPSGRGNVGYGANVGSNHTGKAPDQEMVAGEGVFFGLAASIKFPANYMFSPYSIIATGVCTQPQRVEFPFSLINAPSHAEPAIPSGYNEISPGWVLANNIYSVARNEKKFAARAHLPETAYPVFRPEMVDMMTRAGNILKSAEPKKFYIDTDIPELGKNYMTERSRISGIESYDFYVRLYMGRVLWEYVRKSRVLSDDVFFIKSDDELWEHARSLFNSEKQTNLAAQLRDYAARKKQSAAKMMRSKERDDEKGTVIIDDYGFVNVKSYNDPLVVEAAKEAEETEKAIEKFLNS